MKRILFTVVCTLMATAKCFADDLAKTSQNPVGDIISLPFEYWHHDGFPNSASADALMVKPVYPVNIGNLNVINRFIVPYVSVDAGAGGNIGDVIVPPGQSASGWGNIQYQAFFTPAKPGKAIWGVGPVVEFNTHSKNLGADKTSLGVAGVVLAMPGKWVLGALLQNIWSVSGDSEQDVNEMVFQYFINYNLDKGWYITSTPIITADWEADSDDRWTVPFGGGAGRLVKFGKQPVDFKLQYFNNAKSPSKGADWSLMFAVKLLFPK